VAAHESKSCLVTESSCWRVYVQIPSSRLRASGMWYGLVGYMLTDVPKYVFMEEMKAVCSSAGCNRVQNYRASRLRKTQFLCKLEKKVRVSYSPFCQYVLFP
jgi:hypothetical protein